MRVPNLRLAALALVGSAALSGCAYNGLYGGLNGGYGNYGYGGYGNYGYGYDPYGYGGYGRYGYGYSPYGYSPYGYGYSPFGWYNGFYYPGSGIYVYDRDRRRRVITDAERQYWRDKFNRFRGTSSTGSTATTSSIAPRENWSGFKRGRASDRTTRSGTSSSSDRGVSRQRSSSSTRSTSSSSRSSSSRSSDFMGRHSPNRRNKD